MPITAKTAASTKSLPELARIAQGRDCRAPEEVAQGRDCPAPEEAAQGGDCPAPEEAAQDRDCPVPEEAAQGGGTLPGEGIPDAFHYDARLPGT